MPVFPPLLTVLKSRTVFDSEWIRLEEETVRDARGNERPYVISYSKEYCINVPVNEKGEVLLLRQYKHGVRDYVLTFPAGYCEPGEPAIQTAARELEEETGCTGGTVAHVCSLTENHTTSRSRFHVFVCEGWARNESYAGNPDTDEGGLDEYWIPLDGLLTTGILSQIASASVVAAIPWLFAYLRNKDAAGNRSMMD